MTIKKSYIEVVEFLKANENKKVSSILAEVLLMAESKKASSTYLMNEKDEVIAIFCYYHKQWEFVNDVAYGSKANTATGLNTMCKVGTSMWTKKQRDAKRAKDALLDKIGTGEILPEELKQHQDDIESNRLSMDTTDMPIGYTAEELENNFGYKV